MVSAFSRATWFKIEPISLQEVMEIKSEVNGKAGPKTAATENGTSTVAANSISSFIGPDSPHDEGDISDGQARGVNVFKIIYSNVIRRLLG